MRWDELLLDNSQDDDELPGLCHLHGIRGRKAHKRRRKEDGAVIRPNVDIVDEQKTVRFIQCTQTKVKSVPISEYQTSLVEDQDPALSRPLPNTVPADGREVIWKIFTKPQGEADRGHD